MAHPAIEHYFGDWTDKLSISSLESGYIRIFDVVFSLSDGDLRYFSGPSWLETQMHSDFDDSQRTWQAVTYIKASHLKSKEEIEIQAKDGSIYDEDYYLRAGAGSPYIGYPKTYYGVDHAKHFPTLAEELTKAFPERGRILDLGCATGVLVNELQKLGWDAHGVDISQWAVEHAVCPNVTRGDARSLPFPEDFFDVMISQDVMEHIPTSDLRKVFAEFTRTTKAGGTLFHFIPFYDRSAPAEEYVHLSTAGKSWWDSFFSQTSHIRIAHSPEEGNQWDYSHGILYRYYHLEVAKEGEGSRLVPEVNVRSSANAGFSASEKVLSPGSDDFMVLQVNAKAPSEQYRVHNVSEQLELAGFPHKVLNLPELYANSEKAERLFDEASVILFHRVAYDSLLDKLCARARSRGATLVCETDDLTFFPGLDPRWVDGLRYLSPADVTLYYEGLDRYHRMLTVCDAGLFSTGFLAQIAESMGRQSWILRNALGGEFLDAAESAYRRKPSAATAKLRLGYCSGTKTHDRDFALFAPVLLQLMESDRRLELAILGHLKLPPEFSQLGGRVRHYEPVPWEEVPEILATFSINLAPLELDNPFCRAKSELKYFEAGVLGIPTIASNTDEFAHGIDSGKNGFLVSNEQELEDCLQRLISDQKLREQMGDAARQDVLVRYTPAARARDVAQVLGEIRERKLHR